MNADHAQPQATEPALATPPELQEVLAELSRRELIFHRPEFGTARADFERMTTEDFWETGASGRRYSRAFVLENWRSASPPRTTTSGRRVTSIAADCRRILIF